MPQTMNALMLETVTPEPDPGGMFLYGLIVLLVTGGIASAAMLQSLFPLVATGAGALLYVVLLRRDQPPIQRQVYLTINDTGIAYVHNFKPLRRVTRYAWSEILMAESLLMSQGHDLPGLQLTTSRRSMGGIPVLLPIHGERECRAALAATLRGMERHAATTANPGSGGTC